jgi:transcriptional regulator GlxA family with amidase domain
LLVILQGALYEGERAMRRGELRISPAGDRHVVRFPAPARPLLVHAPGRITTSERLVSSGRRSLLTLADSLSPENVHSSHAARDAAALVKRVVASAEELLDERQATGVPSWLRELHARATSDITSFTRVAALAKHAGVSREHLTRSFRRCYGTSVTSFLRVTRLVHAYDRVKASAAPLAAVAADCGFADQSHMTRLFITHFGASPAALRAQTAAQVTSVQTPRITL